MDVWTRFFVFCFFLRFRSPTQPRCLRGLGLSLGPSGYLPCLCKEEATNDAGAGAGAGAWLHRRGSLLALLLWSGGCDSGTADVASPIHSGISFASFFLSLAALPGKPGKGGCCPYLKP